MGLTLSTLTALLLLGGGAPGQAGGQEGAVAEPAPSAPAWPDRWPGFVVAPEAEGLTVAWAAEDLGVAGGRLIACDGRAGPALSFLVLESAVIPLAGFVEVGRVLAAPAESEGPSTCAFEIDGQRTSVEVSWSDAPPPGFEDWLRTRIAHR